MGNSFIAFSTSYLILLLPVLGTNYLATETMSGGLRTSVKGYIIAKRVTEALEINTVHENETSINVTSNSTAADSVVHPPPLSVPETSMASGSYGFNICDGNIPCLPMLSSAAKVHKSNSNLVFHFICMLCI